MKPAGPVAAKDGTSAGALVPAQVPIPTAPTGEPSASTSASASASASSSATAPGFAQSAYPSRVQHQHSCWPQAEWKWATGPGCLLCLL